jgi:hypothetical protein
MLTAYGEGEERRGDGIPAEEETASTLSAAADNPRDLSV